MKKQDNIEKLFKDAFEGFEADPGVNAWNNIQSNLSAPSSAAGSSSASAGTSGVAGSGVSWVATAIVGVTISAAAIGGYFFFDQTAEKNLAERKAKVEHSEIEPQLPEITSSSLEESNQKPIEETTEADGVDDNRETTASEQSRRSNSISSSIKTEDNNSIQTTPKKSKKESVEQSNDPTSSTEPTAPRLQENQEKISPDKHESGDVDPVHSNTEKKEGSQDAIDSEVANEENSKAEPNNVSKIDDEVSQEEAEETKEPIVELPNIFTPNQDGINDVFNITETNADKVLVKIFSKSNRKIHEWKGKHGYWEGELPDGSIAPEGIYYYQIILEKEGHQTIKRGSVTLKK